ncbi:DUF3540 domain-containing protein [Pseudomonas sp. NPDC086278]|uniref:DUF3540 domain-containing protein n=1 Tax=Pseudomonas sp. NPDC086278 TaxID=3390646 RepID=UPI003CFC48B4
MNEALQVLDSAALLRHVRINAVDGDRFGVVSAEGYRYWLRPALGCLLQPAVGDTVLVSLTGQEGYILSVLERSQPQAAQISVPGDLRLSLAQGALSLETRDGLTLDAGTILAVQSRRTVAHLGDAQIGVDTLGVIGEKVESHWVERHESAVYHSEQAVRHNAEYGDARRVVEGHETLSARSVHQYVEKDWSLQGETLDLFAEVTVAVRSDRIKLG